MNFLSSAALHSFQGQSKGLNVMYVTYYFIFTNRHGGFNNIQLYFGMCIKLVVTCIHIYLDLHMLYVCKTSVKHYE